MAVKEKNRQDVTRLSPMRVERMSLTEQAAGNLREAIITGGLQPGQRLVETELADSLSVSRGTLRGALAALESEGFVARERYSAWRVSSLGPSEIWETYSLRAAFEAMAARLAAEQVNEAIRADLNEHLAALSETGKPAARLEADLALHLAIVRHARHRRLAELYQETLDRFRWIYTVSETRSPERIDLTDWHAPLVEAICAGKPDRAARIAHDQIMTSLSDDLRDLAAQERQSMAS